MSELINKNDGRATIRWKLLTGASALALSAGIALPVKAADTDRPQVWIELAGQFGRQDNGQEIYSPPFLAYEPANFFNPKKYERPPLYGFDENAAISFQPEVSNWIFSASLRYGRSSASKNAHQQTYPGSYFKYTRTVPQLVRPNAAQFIDVESEHKESQLVLDFTAGKDVGLGIFGSDSSSVVSAGVRIAQFRSSAASKLREDPDWHFEPKYFYGFKIPYGQPFHSYYNNVRTSRSFRGIGPSLSWNNSMPIAGNVSDGALAIDWGVNAAVLFGRQKTRVHRQTTEIYHVGHAFYSQPTTHTLIYNHPATPDHTRSHNVTVPNVGGFAGLSYNYANAKISLGYRADCFFGAIDGGIDAARKEDRGFYGPFASISIGLGD